MLKVRFGARCWAIQDVPAPGAAIHAGAAPGCPESARGWICGSSAPQEARSDSLRDAALLDVGGCCGQERGWCAPARPLHQPDQSTLDGTITLDITLGRAQAAMSSQLLHIAQATTNLGQGSRGMGDQRAPAAVR